MPVSPPASRAHWPTVGSPGTALSLEITEDLLFGNMEKSRDVLDQLRRNGIRIAIDDFGSGYSTLSYL